MRFFQGTGKAPPQIDWVMTGDSMKTLNNAVASVPPAWRGGGMKNHSAQTFKRVTADWQASHDNI
jgi:hypothetical protein